MSASTFRVIARKIEFRSEGGSIHRLTRRQVENTVLRIVSSKAFAEGGIVALAPSSIATLEQYGAALSTARAAGL